MPPTYTSRPPSDREITHPPPENHRTPGIRTVTCGSTGIAAVIIADGTARPPPKFPDRFSDAPSRPTPRKQISQSRTHANSGAQGPGAYRRGLASNGRVEPRSTRRCVHDLPGALDQLTGPRHRGGHIPRTHHEGFRIVGRLPVGLEPRQYQVEARLELSRTDDVLVEEVKETGVRPGFEPVNQDQRPRRMEGGVVGPAHRVAQDTEAQRRVGDAQGVMCGLQVGARVRQPVLGVHRSTPSRSISPGSPRSRLTRASHSSTV